MTEWIGQYDSTGVGPLHDIVYVHPSAVAIPWHQRLLVQLGLHKDTYTGGGFYQCVQKRIGNATEYTWERIKE